MCFCMLVCHMCVGAHGSQKRVHDPLELQLQVGLSHWIWLLRTKFESSTRAASILHHSSLSPALFLMILNYACTYIYYGTYVWVRAYEYRYSRRLEEGVRTSGARVTSICESPDTGVRNQTQVLTRTICALNCEPSLQPPKPSL